MRFTSEHEWVRLDGDIATIGITEHATQALGDIVYLEIKEPGTLLSKGDILGVVESVKAASEIYAPIAGMVVEINAQAIADPALVNQTPLGEGWLARLEPMDVAEIDALLDTGAYAASLNELGEGA